MATTGAASITTGAPLHQRKKREETVSIAEIGAGTAGKKFFVEIGPPGKNRYPAEEYHQQNYLESGTRTIRRIPRAEDSCFPAAHRSGDASEARGGIHLGQSLRRSKALCFTRRRAARSASIIGEFWISLKRVVPAWRNNKSASQFFLPRISLRAVAWVGFLTKPIEEPAGGTEDA